ncbi:hypothetical protein CBL_11008 [Carabus blaptoides fortunei]
MKLTKYQWYLCASVCVLTPILAYVLATLLSDSDSILCSAYYFGDDCITDSWMGFEFDTSLCCKLYYKFRAIRRCLLDIDKCGFGDWQLPFEDLIDEIELKVTDIVESVLCYTEETHAIVSEWLIYKLTVNAWSGGIILLYILTYSVLWPLRRHLHDQLLLNKQQPYTFKTSLIFDGKTITILERAKL